MAGAIFDYVTGLGRVTVGTAEGIALYNGGTASRTALASWNSSGTLTNTGGAVIQGLTVGKGGGAVATNTVTGLGALPSNTSGVANTAMGAATMASNTTGGYNSAYGRNALGTNTTGSNNTALGYNSLVLQTTGGSNTAVGDSALFNNTTADNNTAVGFQAGLNNTTGTIITAIGRQALYNNTTGTNNTALSYAMVSNTTGSNNTGIGAGALQLNTTASNNTAVGYQAGYSITTGALNTFVGSQAGGISTVTGQRNVGVGDRALAEVTSGNNNIGFGFTDSVNGYAPVFNPATESNRVVMGHVAITNAYIKVAWTVTSDQRDKTNIVDLDKGLDFVQQLQPKQYQFRTSRTNEIPSGNVRYGFLAQDILALEGNSPVIVDNEDLNHLKYNGESLVPVLVKAIQELNAKVEAQALEIATLKAAK